jgi:ferric-dicitrate binding protein FerR (iron transport regulator)
MTREKDVIHTATTKVTSFKLHDGTVVVLNKNSTLIHSTDFNRNNRKVSLTGEAFFEVFPDKSKEFMVETDHSEVRVVGTSFNVRAVPGSPTNIVEVKEGVVKLNVKGSLSGTLLKAGSKGIVNKKENYITLRETSTDNILAWKTGELVFKATPLEQVLDVVQNYFQVSIKVDNAEVNSCRFTGTFQTPGMEEVMDALSASLDLNVVKNDSFYLLKGDGCK